MKEMIGVVCTASACSTLFLYYHLMKQRDEIHQMRSELTNKYEEEKEKLNKPTVDHGGGSSLNLHQMRSSELQDERNASCLQNPHDTQEEEILKKEKLKKENKEEEKLKKEKLEEENKPVISDNELFSGSYVKSFELRSKLADEIDVLRNSCFQNPHDIQLLRRCALALIKMTHLYGKTSTYREVPEMLKEAISKLNRVLEADQDDYEAIFQLGLAHYYLPKFDFGEQLIISWMKALKCFNKVGDKVPESFKGSNIMEDLQCYLCGEASAVESSEMDDELDDEKHNWFFDIYQRDCEEAEIMNILEANAFHNLRWWSTGDMDNEELLEEPDHIVASPQLAKDHMYDLHGVKAEDFSAECPLLNPELSALSKASPMVLNEMGHVAVLSEERSRRNAQFQTSLFNLGSPKEIDSQHQNYNPRRFLSVECPMRIGVQKLGIPAVAIQIRGMRGTRSYGSAAPILRLLLQQLISRK